MIERFWNDRRHVLKVGDSVTARWRDEKTNDPHIDAYLLIEDFVEVTTAHSVFILALPLWYEQPARPDNSAGQSRCHPLRRTLLVERQVEGSTSFVAVSIQDLGQLGMA